MFKQIENYNQRVKIKIIKFKIKNYKKNLNKVSRQRILIIKKLCISIQYLKMIF